MKTGALSKYSCCYGNALLRQLGCVSRDATSCDVMSVERNRTIVTRSCSMTSLVPGCRTVQTLTTCYCNDELCNGQLLSASYFTLVKEALIEIGCVVTSLVVGWLSRACTVAKRCILGL